MGASQRWKERGKLGSRDGIPYQTARRFSVTNQVVLGSWTVDICQGSRSQRSAPQKTHGKPPRKPSSWDQGGGQTYLTWGCVLDKHLVA